MATALFIYRTPIAHGLHARKIILILKDLMLEARVGIEPTNKGFSDPGLTTWLPRHYRKRRRRISLWNISRLPTRSQFSGHRRNYRQQHIRIPLRFMVHRLHCRTRLLHTRIRDRTSGIRVAIKTREVAAGNLQPDPVARPKHVAGDARVDGDSVVFAGCDELRRLERIAVAHAENAVGEIARRPVRKDVDQLR